MTPSLPTLSNVSFVSWEPGTFLLLNMLLRRYLKQRWDVINAPAGLFLSSFVRVGCNSTVICFCSNVISVGIQFNKNFISFISLEPINEIFSSGPINYPRQKILSFISSFIPILYLPFGGIYIF